MQHFRHTPTDHIIRDATIFALLYLVLTLLFASVGR